MSTRTAVAALSLFLLVLSAAGAQNSDEQLFNAAFTGDAAAVRALLTKGANPNTTFGTSGKTALMAAASRGKVDIVRSLLAAGATPNARDSHNMTALMLAALSSSGEVVDLLIRSGANVNVKTTRGQTALMFAALLAKVNTVQSLLRAKAEIQAEDEDGWTALNWAQLNNDPQVEVLLKQAGARKGMARFVPADLVKAAFGGDVAVVKQFIKDGQPLNATDEGGHTALVAAAEEGRIEVVKLLLSAGADPNITDNMRPRGLAMIASENVLLAGIDEVMETGRAEGITPLQFASRFGHAEVVRMLLAAGAKVNARSGGLTPLLLALESRESSAVVHLLLEAGAEVDAQDKSGMTALMIAALNGDLASARLLLAHGANMKVTDRDGHTALWWGRDQQDIVSLLNQAQTK